MNGVNGYQKYQSNYAEAASIYKRVKDDAKAEKSPQDKATGETGVVYEKGDPSIKKEPVRLSENAKKLLEELKAKYSNMDFIVENYSTDAEAARYLAMGQKEYSVLIDPDTLEKMAADEEVKAKYVGIIDDALKQFGEIKEQLEDAEEEQDVEVTRIGITVGNDGTVNYFAELRKTSEKQQERLEKAKEKRAEEEKKAEKQAEKKKAEQTAKPETESMRVTASSVEELLEKIREADWTQAKAPAEATGTRFDFTI